LVALEQKVLDVDRDLAHAPTDAAPAEPFPPVAGAAAGVASRRRGRGGGSAPFREATDPFFLALVPACCVPAWAFCAARAAQLRHGFVALADLVVRHGGGLVAVVDRLAAVASLAAEDDVHGERWILLFLTLGLCERK